MIRLWRYPDWTLALLALCLTAPAAAAGPDRRAADERAVVAGERAWGQAYVTGDVATIRRLLTDDFQGVDPHGAMYDKASVLRDVREGPRYASDEVGPVSVRFYGNTAIAQAREREVGPPPARQAGEHVFTDTWVKLGGRWRIVAAEDVEGRPTKTMP
ncbi:MAG: nuclear transport factor 2 family protein [Caulobacteraceae bacterium]